VRRRRDDGNGNGNGNGTAQHALDRVVLDLSHARSVRTYYVYVNTAVEHATRTRSRSRRQPRGLTTPELARWQGFLLEASWPPTGCDAVSSSWLGLVRTSSKQIAPASTGEHHYWADSFRKKNTKHQIHAVTSFKLGLALGQETWTGPGTYLC
jgi:hypothetical protein